MLYVVFLVSLKWNSCKACWSASCPFHVRPCANFRRDAEHGFCFQSSKCQNSGCLEIFVGNSFLSFFSGLQGPTESSWLLSVQLIRLSRQFTGKKNFGWLGCPKLDSLPMFCSSALFKGKVVNNGKQKGHTSCEPIHHEIRIQHQSSKPPSSWSFKPLTSCHAFCNYLHVLP